MLRGLILDADGVLILGTSMTARRDWERRHDKPEGSLDAALSEAVGPGWAGGRGEEEIQRRLGEILGIDRAALPEVLEVLAAHQVLNDDLTALLAEARPTLRTAILTNSGPTRRAELTRRFAADTLVDLIVVSAEEGMAKPDPAIFALTCQRLGVEPGECLFVDDAPANVAGAVRAGLRAEVYTSVARLRHVIASATTGGR
jgi:HAD superfamily hydrolase (TIGR01509 family)